MTLQRAAVLLLLVILCFEFASPWLNFNSYTSKRRTDLKKRCPNVRAIRNFDLESMMGFWYVVQYYASSEELPEYACMQSDFTFSVEDQHVSATATSLTFTHFEESIVKVSGNCIDEYADRSITMNFSYIFAEDPLREKLQGNITWLIPDFDTPAHWMHTEDIYEGIYNTYVIDTDYKSWGLIMHCAEKKKSPRYLSALLLSREPTLGENVVNFLREKLPRYDIDLSFMFAINQTCDNLMESVDDDPLAYIVNGRKNAKNMFKVITQH